MTYTYPLQFRTGHLFVEIEGGLWLLDTGGPVSFGVPASLELGGEEFSTPDSFGPLDTAELSDFVGVPCAGLLGADILKRFDVLIDVPGGTLTVSQEELSHGGESLPLDKVMGIPIVTARVAGVEYRMFFDTGAQFSYFQDDSITTFPEAGVVNLYPSVGWFQTQTYHVPVSLGGMSFTIRCSRPPESLVFMLEAAHTRGIIGNEILLRRTAGYFPRRRLLVL